MLPLRDNNLFHVYRLPAGRNEVHGAFVEGRVIAHSLSRHIESFPLLDTAHELLFPLDVCRLAYGRRVGVLLHLHVLVIKLSHRLNDLALTDVAEQIVQPLL